MIYILGIITGILLSIVATISRNYLDNTTLPQIVKKAGRKKAKIIKSKATPTEVQDYILND